MPCVTFQCGTMDLVGTVATGGRREGASAAPLLAPALIGLAVFAIGPTLLSVLWGGTDKSLTGSNWHWVGLANLREATSDPAVQRAVGNTLAYCALTIVPAVALGLGLALLVDRVRRGRGLVRLLLFLPVTANLVAMSVVFQYIFSSDRGGLANSLLSVIGVRPLDWLGSSPRSLFVVAIVGLWRLSSFVFVIYLSGLTAVPRTVFEAADVDGLRGWARFRWVTWPLLGPTTVFVLVLTTLLTLQTFETVAVLTQGGPLGGSETLVYRIWSVGFTPSFRIGYASLLSFMLLIVVIGIGALGSLAGRRLRQRVGQAAA